MGWIGVDLDGTLAEYNGWKNGEIGEPVPAMLERVKRWIQNGTEVRILTARVNPEGRPHRDVAWQIDLIERWCLFHIGKKLPITCSKSYDMVVLYDDRVRHIETNTGRIIG